MCIDPCKHIGYVNNYGSASGVGSGNGHTVSVVDLKSNTIISTIDVDLAPAALAISHNLKYVYVICYVDGNPGTGTMNVISTKTNTVISTVIGLFGPFDIAITNNDKYALLSQFGNNDFTPYGSSVAVVDLKKLIIKKNIYTGIQPSGVAIDDCDKYCYVTNYNTLYAGANFTNLTAGQGTVSIIDICKKKVVATTIPVGQSPANIIFHDNTLYVSCFTSNCVNKIIL